MRTAGVFAVLCCALLADAARLLAVLPTNTRSHFAMYGRLLDALAKRNHHLTIISHFPMKNPPPNVEEISVAGTIPDLSNNLTSTRATAEWARNLDQIVAECVQACDSVSRVPAVRALLNTSARYDMVIVEVFGSDCFLPLGRLFDAPVVGLLSSVPLPWHNAQLGNPEATAYVPSYMMGYGQSMSLWERFMNTIAVQWAKIIYRYKSQLPSQTIADRLFGPGPRLDTLAQDYRLVLANSHFSINEVRPLVPAYVEVGGLHLDNSQPIPRDLKVFLDSSTEGVIYWSFGSMSRIETIPTKTLKQIFDVFARLQQKVLIKMNRSRLSHNVTIPDNVYTGGWMPQYNTLCHPNVKLFISHGGLLGTQEAVACGVPMLVVPLYADQALNARAMSDRGVARILPFPHINSRTWRDSIVDLLGNAEYKEKATKLSELFLDRPLSPLDTGVYWIEYVLRHRGAKHMRSPSLDLPLYQYLLLDILALSIVITLASIFLLYILVRSLCARCIKWWPLEKLLFEENLLKQGSLLFCAFARYKVKTN